MSARSSSTGAESGSFWLSSGFGKAPELTASASGLAVAERHQTDVGFDSHLLAL